MTYHEATSLYFLFIPRMSLSMVYPLLFRTKTIGVSLLVITVDSSWTVSCLKGHLSKWYDPFMN